MNTYLILILGGGLMMLNGIHHWRKAERLTANGKKTKGIIFANNLKASGLHFPVVRFLTDKKEWITQELDTGYKIPMNEGEEVDIVYHADDPQDFQINKNFELLILPRLLVALGVTGIIAGTVGYITT
jgi:hypothetical protein